MNGKEHLFPIASFSRATGKVPARESLPERESPLHHPLLSPVSPSPPTTTAATASSAYVPYTPRQQRQVASSSPLLPETPFASTATTTAAAAAGWKTAAEALGLNSDTVGWTILHKLVETDNTGSEWDDLWATLQSGKATLLLPAEPATPQDVIGPEFVKDHLVYSTTLPAENGAFVTLSGLRATWTQDAIIIRGVIPTSSNRFARVAAGDLALSQLPPLPTNTNGEYTRNTLLAHEAKLSLAPQPDAKPALPPRPGARSTLAASGSRINPFASLFGKAGPSAADTSAASDTPREPLGSISAVSIARRIIRRDMQKDIAAVRTAAIKTALSDLPAPIVARVLAFVAPLLPTYKAKSSTVATNTALVSPPPSSSPDLISEAFQDLYRLVEDELQETKNDAEPPALKYTDGEVRVLLNRIEDILCAEFYDHLFRPVESDDASHDEALSSRVAALNMLDLSLDHLGVDAGAGSQETEVDGVVKECGDVLQQLSQSDSQTASQKAAILVACHRTVVDGLGRLRHPVKLKPEGETPPPPSPRVHPGEEQEMAEPSSAMAKASEEEERAAAERAAKILAESRVPPPLPPRPKSPIRIPSSPAPTPASIPETSSPVSEPTPVASDVLLPLIIFAVVKANPAQLVSQLLFVQRFHKVQGEEAFCLVNLMAVVEFLENVDLAALGLGEGKVISVEDLTPIPLLPHTETQVASSLPAASTGARLRGQAAELADSAGKLVSGVTGVVDTSFGVLRGLLPTSLPMMQRPGTSAPVMDKALADAQSEAPWNIERTGFGLLRRASGFSIASIPAAVFPRSASRLGQNAPPDVEEGQQLIDVPSRASSVHGLRVTSDFEQTSGDDSAEDSSEESDEDDDERSRAGVTDDDGGEKDGRSIRSFSSMLSTGDGLSRGTRLSLSDRLAHAAAKSKQADGKASLSASPAMRSATLPTISLPSDNSVGTTTATTRIAPPNKRFMTVADAGELRVSEVAELLTEYRRVVEGLRAAGGFRDH